MERKAPRRTKERILEVSLAMFNSFGEPNVTTNAIADEMNISPGNLYYHYRSKDEIVTKIFGQFERELDELFAMGKDRAANVEDTWFWLHLLFEKIWKYRFIYRDLNHLLSKNRIIETHFKTLLENSQKKTERLMTEMRSINELSATDGEIHAVATNLVMIVTFWHSYAYVMNPRKLDEEKAMNQGVFQVMVLLAPYLQGDARLLFEKLAAEYR
ncbi:MAG TPA: TetR/AcrR family transcriptional regulator [Casimicrobium sp.]|jgi:AcrR family transcriptional regulator|nr:TetR/AcrR family transcriptional regulator [Burkholderiales bacterium]HNY48206.1 TetR/AcrR family transcriptional regulator [Casimicrobium sp.]HPG62295.1 TetR/AcrR family transcriptional regulator [Casimicrobium sp.]HPT57111.1 TetR/AcrR family transcriptional regulator [Casimicrobium sp.]